MFSNAMKSSLVRTGRKSPPNRAFRRRIPSLRPGPWLPGRRQEEEARGGRQREGGGGLEEQCEGIQVSVLLHRA